MPFEVNAGAGRPVTPEVVRQFEQVGVTRLSVSPFGYPDPGITAERIEAGLEQFANDVMAKV